MDKLIDIYTDSYPYTYTCERTHTSAQFCTVHIYTHPYIYIYIYIQKERERHRPIYTPLHTRIQTPLYTHTHTHAYKHPYTHTHTHTRELSISRHTTLSYTMQFPVVRPRSEQPSIR